MRSLRPTLWLLGGLLTLAGTSCGTEDPEPEIFPPAVYKVSYAQTQCADKWGPAPTTQQLETVATTYLAQQGITLKYATATQATPAAVCNACTCPTGLVLTGQVDVSQLAAIEALGFKKL